MCIFLKTAEWLHLLVNAALLWWYLAQLITALSNAIGTAGIGWDYILVQIITTAEKDII